MTGGWIAAYSDFALRNDIALREAPGRGSLFFFAFCRLHPTPPLSLFSPIEGICTELTGIRIKAVGEMIFADRRGQR